MENGLRSHRQTRLHHQSSMASRATVRSLIVACLPAAAAGLVAGSPALGAALSQASHHGLTVDDNNGAATNSPGTNSSGIDTNDMMPLAGARR
jgi:hypothetical protein